MTDSTQTRHTRRSVVRASTVGVATVISPQFVTVASGATASGNVEVTTTATVPTDTSIEVTVYEDEGGDSTAERSQTQSISGGSDVVTEFDQLTGDESNTWTYWVDVSMSTNDTSVTPELDSMTITLPEPAEPAEPTQPVTDGITLPMQIDLADMQTGVSVFLIGLLGGLMGASALFRNPAAAIMTGLCIVILVSAGLFGFGLELFWLGVVITALLLVVGIAARWST